MLPISRRAVRSGSTSSWVGVVAVTVTPRAAASRAMTRSVTSSWVSQRRGCLPSLVCGRGSADTWGAPRSAASRASTSATGTGVPATMATAASGLTDRHRDRGVYSSRPAQPIRTSAHHCPGHPQGGGATSKPMSTVEPARRTTPAPPGPSTPRCPTG